MEIFESQVSCIFSSYFSSRRWWCLRRRCWRIGHRGFWVKMSTSESRYWVTDVFCGTENIFESQKVFFSHRKCLFSHRKCFWVTIFLSHRKCFLSHRKCFFESQKMVLSHRIFFESQKMFLSHRKCFLSQRKCFLSHRKCFSSHRKWCSNHRCWLLLIYSYITLCIMLFLYNTIPNI